MDATTDPRPRLYLLRLPADLVTETRVDEVRASLARKSPSWRAAQADPFAAVTAGRTREVEIPF
jgi:hypothetical protein